MSAANSLSKTEYLAVKPTSCGKCKLLRAISETKTLSADISANQRGIHEVKRMYSFVFRRRVLFNDMTLVSLHIAKSETLVNFIHP